MEISLNNRIETAKRLTAKTAMIKDWRIRNRHNRAMREIARGLTAGKGYVIASPRELSEIYPDFYGCDTAAQDSDVKMIWGLDVNSVWRKIQFVSI